METTKATEKQTMAKDVNWDQLYVLNGHWKSDLEFYMDDLQFLFHLVDKYMLWITKQENLEMVKEIKSNTYELKLRCQDLIVRVRDNQHQLGLLVEGADNTIAQAALSEHGLLESEMSLFVKEFRAVRKETFKITEYVIDNESLPSLLEK